MIHRSLVRALMLSAAFAAGLVLSGCDGDSLSPGAKAARPIPEKLLNEMESKNMDKGAPMLVRLFKQEAELEVWKQDRTGRFALLKTYPICRWSGDIGPKVREGDRQAPEGFYAITPAQMNPNSGYYLSFNIGYPNAYDKAWGRTGSQLMVHGDCSSRGCYAMTDEQISEIYALGRESFFGGQNAFQVQAYPFRMTPQNMARNRDNPNMPFWRMIKEGNDYFEVTKQEPKVDFCEKKYVFGAQAPAGSSRQPAFNASAKCPAYEVPAEIAGLVKEKERADQTKLAELISRGTPVSKPRVGIDGGMHPVFATKLPDAQSIAMTDATDFTVASYGAAPGTIPSHVNPPKLPDAPVAADTAPMSADSGPGSMATANANASANAGSTGGSFFSNLAAKVGLRGNDKQETPTASTQQAVKPATTPAPKSKPIPKTSDVARATESAGASSARVISLDKPKQGQTTAQAKSPFPDPPAQAAAPVPAQSMAGAQPPVPAGSFDSRWSSLR
ncbi:MAG: murein L,D-transpeptidase [Xanthobacteraceae bacterium]|nr:murein L,D-transpeptidase [Xanthobacteraceae bacterium]